MENTIVMVMQTVQAFGEKMKTHGLTEFEVLMYEQACRMVETFCKIQDRIGKIQLMKLEQASHEEQLKHEKWESEKNASFDLENREPPQGDEGSDPGSGCPKQPA